MAKKYKSTDYGKTVWLSNSVYEQLQSILDNFKDKKITITPGDVIEDLLKLSRIPKLLLNRMKKEFDPIRKEVYHEILQYIIQQRTKK